MAFINDYLTKGEREKIAQYNIPYPQGSDYEKRKIAVGNDDPCCTVDREREMYLFQSINSYNRREFDESTEYFTFVIIKEGKASVMYVNLEKDRSVPYEERDYDIMWNLRGYELSKAEGYTEEEMMKYFKEAMCAYGFMGDIENKEFNVNFSF